MSSNLPLSACYCGEELIEFDDNGGDWQCQCCFIMRQDDVSHDCYEGDACLFKQVTDAAYGICVDCFAALNSHDMKAEVGQRGTLVERKLVASSLIISLAFC